jgi:guanylate kinase
MNNGLMLIVSGPSGSGKDTLISHLMNELDHIKYSISATTRAPRDNEVDGVSYFFVDKAEFQAMIDQGDLLEWAKIYDDYYGTPRRYVSEAIAQGYDVILKIDVQGAGKLRATGEDGVFIFIAPPSMEELKRRIVARGTESPAAVDKRFRTAVGEIQEGRSYDYIVINEEIPHAVEQLKAIILAEKCRVKNQQHLFDVLIED